MKGKTVAARAAELGTDQETLVRALKALCVWRTKSDGWGRTKKSVMDIPTACLILGLQVKDAKKLIDDMTLSPWSKEKVVDGILAFMEREGRWPRSKELLGSNGLPSWHTWELLANAEWQAYSTPGVGWWRRNNGWIRPRDYWERRVAADKRCTPKMAIQLRNVLARKEAIERIGFDTFIKQGVATVISKHAEFGTLYRLPGETPSEPMVLLKVINSTPGPDGKFEPYYLRVPPTMTDVQEAVAWTFNSNGALAGAPYAPVMET